MRGDWDGQEQRCAPDERPDDFLRQRFAIQNHPPGRGAIEREEKQKWQRCSGIRQSQRVDE